MVVRFGEENMKKIILIVAVSLFSNLCFAQAPEWEWAKGFGGINEEYSSSITIDDSNNIYTIGSFNGTVDFDPGLGIFNLTSIGSWDAYISKFDSSCNLIWVKSIGGIADDCVARSIKNDSDGNIYVIGSYEGSIDFDSDSTSNFILNSLGGSWDIFILKLDSDGNFAWVKTMGGQNNDGGNSISLDAFGNVLTTGNFYGQGDFDPDSLVIYNVSTTNGIGMGVFISKLDTSGNFVWAKAIGGGYSNGRSIAVGTIGNIYTTGSFQGGADFDPGSGTYYLNSGISQSVFISNLDSLGNFVWAKSFGSDSYGNSIAVDDSENVYTTGNFSGTVDFDPGTDVFNLSSSANGLIFISKLNNNGSFVWAKAIGGSTVEQGQNIMIDAAKNIYISGVFSDTVDFNPDGGVFNLIATPFSGYISKLNKFGNFVWAKTVGKPDWWGEVGGSIDFDSEENLFVTGNFIGENCTFDSTLLINTDSTGQFADIFISKLSSCPTSKNITAYTCNSYASPSGNYTWSTSGVYQDYIQGTNGCDTIIVINLVVNTSIATIYPTACHNYISPSGIYNWTTSGTYYDTIPNIAGCDSFITIQLTVNFNDTSMVQNGTTLTVSPDGPTFCQWLDCNNGFSPIIGENNYTFNATVNGSYAVAMSIFGCPDTSACYSITGAGINEITTSSNFQLSPNPTADIVTVQLHSPCSNCTIEISNVLGEILFTDELNQKSKICSLQSFPSGIYFIKVKSDKWSEVKRVVKE